MEWLSISAVVVVGLMVGVEASVAFVINPIVDRLPGNAGLLARSDGGRMLGRVMPVWYVVSLLLTVATAASRPGAAAAWSAAGLLVASIVMSVTLLVPINNRSTTWTPETAPADWREQIGRWDRFHVVRVAMIVAAFTLLTVTVAGEDDQPAVSAIRGGERVSDGVHLPDVTTVRTAQLQAVAGFGERADG